MSEGTPVLPPSGAYSLGCRPSLPDPRNFRFGVLQVADKPQTDVDYRADLPACHDQGPENACTSFAVGAAYRFARRKRHGWPRPAVWSNSLRYNGQEDFDVSFQTLYFLSRRLEGTTASDAGASLGDAVKVLHQFGACAWHNYAYVAGDQAQVPPAKAIANASHHEVASYYQLDGSDRMYKQALSAGYLPIVGVAVVGSLFDVGTDGIVQTPLPGDAILGGHALCVCGYRSSDGAYLVRNSWGTVGWGMAGYGWFKADYLTNPQLCFESWCISVGSL